MLYKNYDEVIDGILNIDSFEYDETQDRILCFPQIGRSSEDDDEDNLTPYLQITFDENGSPISSQLEHKVVASDFEKRFVCALYEAVFDDTCETPADTCDKMNEYVNVTYRLFI